ncbi:hypothetical protein V6N13_047321 [Hibiscus sabdariffa]|uniref:RING-type E3 ubiquitin transferase n=1 Tax=Hibiscus sabdariffa TaxID=183260 RepID=A0ABR2F3T7_9ROSI
MESRELRFEVRVDHCLNPNIVSRFPQMEFLLIIRTFLEDGNCSLRRDARHKDDEAELFLLPENTFGSVSFRGLVAHRLLQAGWLDQGGLVRILDQAFSDANSILEKEKLKNRNNNGFSNARRIIFRAEVIVMRDNCIECMICLEKLGSSKTKVVTSMPCSHLFHGDCIEKWLNTSCLCPLCRFSVPENFRVQLSLTE